MNRLFDIGRVLSTVLNELLAKSAKGNTSAELLTTHLKATLRSAYGVEQRIGRIDAVLTELSPKFWQAVSLACLTHDGGKVSDGFQGMLSGLVRGWGERHEVLSLGFLPYLLDDADLLKWVATGVATHHRPLTGPQGNDLKTLYGGNSLDELTRKFSPIVSGAVPSLGEWLYTTAVSAGLPVRTAPGELSTPALLNNTLQVFEDFLTCWEDDVTRQEGLSAVLLQGAVTLADHLSSAHSPLAASQPLDASFPALLEQHLADKGSRLRPHQHDAGQITGHLLLRAPTGSGKTEAVLLWATRQVADVTSHVGGVPRVFYMLPYLSSINAMTDRLTGVLQDEQAVGVAHSRAGSYHLGRAIAPQDGECSNQDDGPAQRGSDRVEAASKAVSRAAATQLFHETLRVGTPYQVLRAALAGPAYSSTLLDTVNSVFVLDELHAYDPQRLGYILASVRVWERLGGRIAVLSATLPEALEELFTESLQQQPTTLEASGLNLPPRHRLRTRGHHLTDPRASEEIRARLADNTSVLVVANNVAHALHIYEELAPEVIERYGPDSAYLLHSRFTHGDRITIENKINNRFGSDAAMRGPGILVATQVVEVSLDVDFDVLFTAAAPLEALLQRFGRTNRLANRPPADVIVHQPTWKTRRSQAGEFADGVYPRKPVEFAWDHLCSHDGRTVDEADATEWLNTIYNSDWGQQWREEVDLYKGQFEDAFYSFTQPFADREELTKNFDKLFDGMEGILERDRESYAAALQEGNKAAGRLLAEDYLIPLPYLAGSLGRYDRTLRVRIVNGDYDSQHGLTAIRHIDEQSYEPGVVM